MIKLYSVFVSIFVVAFICLSMFADIPRIPMSPTPTSNALRESFIVFTSNNEGKFAIYEMDMQNNVQRITNLDYDRLNPSISPSGEAIAYLSRGGLYVYKFACQCEFLVADKVAGTSTPIWSPDGRRITFVSWRDNESKDIYSVYQDGTDVRRLTRDLEDEIDGITWSPNGKFLAFSARHAGSQINHIIILDTGSGSEHELNTWDAVSPVWSPDGRQFAFVVESSTSSKIYISDMDGSNIHALIRSDDNKLQQSYPAWSLDSLQIAFIAFDPSNGTYIIHVINRDGTQEKSVTSEFRVSYDPSWGTRSPQF